MIGLGVEEVPTPSRCEQTTYELTHGDPSRTLSLAIPWLTAGSPPRGLSYAKHAKPLRECFYTPFEAAGLCQFGFYFRDNFLGARTANQVRTEAQRLARSGVLKPAGTGRERRIDGGVRGDNLCWVEKSNAGSGIRALMSRFEVLRQTVNQQMFLGVNRYEMQLAQYPTGSQGYSKHFDAFRGGSQNRRLTAIYYLNPQWQPGDGGELSLTLPQGQFLLEPLQDRLVVFLAEEIEHAVLPTQASRLALTAWFHGS